MHRHLALVPVLVGSGLAVGCKDDSAKEHRPKNRPHEAPASPRVAEIEPVEASPHFPTASAAGTEKLFFLEEPDRGKHVTEVVVPTGGKTTMKSGYCEIDEHDVVCVAGPGPYRVRQVAGVRVVERLRSRSKATTYVIEKDSKGDLVQIGKVDAYGDVVWVRSYREQGTKYSSRTLDGGNELEGCGSRALEVNEKGQATSVTCLQWNGSPMLDASGVARSVLSRDDLGMIVKVEFFDVEMSPAERHDGVHAMVYKRSKEGHILRTDYWGHDGKAAISTRGGCASTESVFDGAGNEVKRTCLDGSGAILGGAEGIATSVYKHNSDGCLVSESFLDPAGQPQSTRRRGYEQRYVVNKRCEPLEVSCHDAGGALTGCEGGVARRTYKYDTSGRVVSVQHFDAAGAPARAPGLDRFEIRNKYDARGNQIERACFDVAGLPVECSGTGAHAFTEAYDLAGRKVETRYLDTSRESTKSLGTTVSRSVYDNYDHISQVLREDEKGTLISSNGMSKMTYLYDRGHQVFGVLLHDAEDKPANYGACFVGLKCPDVPWHALRVMRSERGELVSNVFFDSQRRELETIDCATTGCFGQ